MLDNQDKNVEIVFRYLDKLTDKKKRRTATMLIWDNDSLS